MNKVVVNQANKDWTKLSKLVGRAVLFYVVQVTCPDLAADLVYVLLDILLNREIKSAFVKPANPDFVVQTFDPLAGKGLGRVKPESLLSLLICKCLLFVKSLGLLTQAH